MGKLDLCINLPCYTPILIQASHPYPMLVPDFSCVADKDTSTTVLGTYSKVPNIEKGYQPAVSYRLEYFRLIRKIGEILAVVSVCKR